MLFEQRLNLLKNLKTLWANDTAVLLTPIDVRDENDRQFIVESNDEVVFENENFSEFCNEVVIQDLNILGDVNLSSLGHTEVIEEVNMEESNKENEVPVTADINVRDCNNQSQQTVQVNDINLSTIKMPVAIKKRGRPKGQDLTVIGLPKRRKRKPLSFSKKSYQEKQDLILNFFVQNGDIVKDIKNGKILEDLDLKSFP
ncbi:hypothetical protein PPYR_03025 [Photinus pyralis]|nr:hypothetical protein PPYR_03025 [Photinus pyralis]